MIRKGSGRCPFPGIPSFPHMPDRITIRGSRDDAWTELRFGINIACRKAQPAAGKRRRSQLSGAAVQENNNLLGGNDPPGDTQRAKGTVLYMVFVAPDRDFGGLRPVFDRIVRGFVLRD